MKKFKIIQFILLLGSILYFPFTTASAQNWTPTTTPGAQWQTVAGSADGRKLFAGALGYTFCVSTNSGTAWSTNTQPQVGSFGSWSAITCSADGTKLAAINFDTYWISADSGATWVSNSVAGVSFFSSVAMSADGTRLVIADGKNFTSGVLYVSTDSGATLTPAIVPTASWTGVASSADGTRFYATAQNFPYGQIYASTNSGLTWAPTGASTNDGYLSIASSADGSHLVASGFNGIYTSTNFGGAWTSNNVPIGPWLSVASSADGTRLLASSQTSIYTSTNSGASWVSNDVPKAIWTTVASSADGGLLTAVPEGNAIYISSSIPSPKLGLTGSPANLTLSWIVPSTNFIVQQSADLTSWTDLSVTPALNFTNLQNQVCVTPATSAVFYRLKTP